MATLGKNQVFEIKNGDGTSFHNLVLRKSAVESVVMSLGDKISGDVYYKDNTLSVTMHEYITYNGVNYMLINPPTIVREGVVSDNSELRGMTKYSFVFYHPMCQLSNFPFTDVAVTNDETRYLSESKTFSWIGKPADFVAKMNKNLDGTEWIVEISSRFPQDKLNELSDVIPFDNATIADACKTFYDTWGVPYVVDKVASTEASYAVGKRFKLVMGLPSNEIYENAAAEQQQTPFVFQMGHGVGLKNNSRTPRNNKIITRISGYGSENNIPYGYPQVRWYGTAGQSFTYGDHAGVYTNVTIGGVHFDKVVSYPIYKGILDGEYVELIKHPFTRTHLMPSVYRTTLFNKISFYDAAGEANTDYDPDITLVDYYDAVYSAQYPYPNTINLQAPSYESHEFEDEKPELGEAHIISATPLNNDLTPASSWDDSLDDEGNYKQSYFQMVLPQLSFDLYACASITEEMQINMRSGACLGCTFTVQVDWDDYKRNFYDDEGNFAPNGSQRDLTKYPKSNQGSISLILQKDNSTFGTLMPNMYQYPKGETSTGAADGDTFVILGISLPESYIFAAEWRLDADMKSYMLENNVHYFDYPLKFDEDFLFHKEYILSQIRPNTVVRFNYAGQTQALFVKQITVKYGDQPLPQYDITLTDNVEVVLNQIGQVAEDVEKLSTLIAILRQSYGKNVWNELAKKLSKTQDDTAAGYITMLKGLQVGANFVPDILGEGGVLRMRDDGKVELVTDILYARMRAYFDSVVIREYRHESGNRIKSPAQGFNASRVEYIKVVDNVETIVDDASEADYFRCYWRVDDGEKKAENQFIIGDLAFCENSDIVNGSLVTKRYWRVVTGRNAGNTTTADGEAWIDLSNAHDANGNPVMTTISWEGQGGTTQTLSVKSFESSANSYPEAHDDICMLGCTTDTTRQGAIIEYVSGVDAPTYQIYQGLGADATNPYSLSGKNQIGFGYSTSTGKAYMNVYGDTYIGDRNRNTFLEYKQNGAGGNPELNIKAKVQILPNGSTINGQSIPDYIKDNQNNYDDTEVQQAISDLNDTVGNLQDQIDGSIETLYGDVDPSVPSNDPYKDYTTDEKEKHLGDMYYNSTTGYAYRYDKSVEEVGGEEVTTYFWQIIRDTGITQAIAEAGRALGLADTKAKIFTTNAGTLPSPPYKVNDVWVNATYPANGSTYSNEILKCVTAREQGATANIADWAKASKYTDDSSLQNFISATYDPTIAGLTEQVDRKIESWFQSADPSADWYDDTQTPILDVRADHVGDMWYSESTHLLKRYDSETTGEGEQAVTTYFWTTIQDQKAIDAYDNAAHAQDTADGKRRVFTAQPVAADAYDVGDLWVNATYPATGTKTYENDVLRCKTAKAAGETFNISHWQKASKYTDDSAFNGYITAFLSGSGASGDSATVAAIQKAIAGALGSGTVVDGGLLLSSLIGMRKYKGSGSVTELSSYDTWGGISGEYNDDDETVQGGAKGHGIAAWYGGDMVDKEMLSDEEIANGWGTGEGQYRWAKSVDRFDGSGYRANGNITWNANGELAISDITSIQPSGSNTNVLNDMIQFSNAFHFNTVQGGSTILNIVPQYPFYSLYLYDTSQPNNRSHVASQKWVDDHYVTKTFFRQLFRAFKPNATAGQADVEVEPNTIDATISNIKAMVGLWTEQYISALGRGADGGGGGASVLYGLNDVTPNATGDGVMGAQDGYVLTYNGSTHHWYAAATAETYILPQATSGALGGIKIGYVASGKNYAIVLDTNGKAYVNVPWTDTTYTLPTATTSALGGVKVGYTTNDKNYAVSIDNSGNLYVNVPWTDNNTWIPWAGATENAAGTAGYMPAPTSAQRTKYLRGDGTWQSLNNYSLPLAASGVRGGVQVGYTTDDANRNYAVQLSSEKMYVNVPWQNTNTWRNILLAGTQKLGTGTDTKGLNFVGDGKTTITFLDAGTDEGQSGSADYATIKISSTWRGIQDNLTSDSTTDSLSAKQGKNLKSSITTLEGYFTNGVANAAVKLNTSRTLWGQSFNGTANVSGSLTGVGNITMGSTDGTYIKIGDIYIGYDSTNSAIEIYKLGDNNAHVAANLYAHGAISALGQGVDGGGGGGQGDVTWDLLAHTATDNRFIDSSYISGALAGYSLTSHTHTTTIAAGASTDTSQLTLAHGTKYKLTAGGTSFVFTMPSGYSLPTASSSTLGGVKVGSTLAISSGVLNLATSGVTAGTYKCVTVDAYGRVTAGDNTDSNTWRNIYLGGTSKVGTGTDTKALNFVAGSNVTISYEAAGTGDGKSGSADYFNIKIAATDTTYSAATQSAAGLMSAADKKKLDGVATNANNYSHPTGGANTTIEDADGKVLCAITVNNLGHVTSVSSKTLAAADIPNLAASKITSGTFDSARIPSLAISKITNLQTSLDGKVNLSDTEQTIESTISSLSKGVVEFYRSSGNHYSMIGFANKDDNGNKQTLGFIGFESGTAGQIAYMDASGNSYTIWHEGNDGADSGLDADLLDGTHKSGLFTALSSNSTTKLSITIGGTTKTLSTLYASHAAQLTTSRSLWGNSFNGTGDINGNIVMASSDGTYIQIGGARIVWDNTNKALKVIQSDNSTAANFYATGAISALGQGVDGGGGGGQGDVTWDLLSHTATNNRFIDSSYISGTLAGYLPLSGGSNKPMTGTLYIGTGLGISDASGNGLLCYKPDSWTGVSNIQWGLGTVDVQGVIRSSNSDLVHYRGGNNYNILDGANSSVSKSGDTLTVKINGTSQSLTNTNTTYSANNGVSLSGTTFYNSGVRATTINGDYLRVNTNGTNADLTIPYATIAGSTKKLASYYDSRPSTANLLLGDASLRFYEATSSMTEGKPTIGDSSIIHLSWDTDAGWEKQIAVGHGDHIHMMIRAQSSGTWGSWINILDSDNSSVSLSGSTLTVKINGTTKSLTNTDVAVNQSETTTSSYRGIVLGYNSNSAPNAGITGNCTNVVYTTNNLVVQPSSGNIYTAGNLYVGCGAAGVHFGGSGMYWHNSSNAWTANLIKSTDGSHLGIMGDGVSTHTVNVSGTLRSKDITIWGNADTETALRLVGSQYQMEFLVGSGNVNRGIYNRTGNAWMFYFDASNTIMNYGNVGIGTTSPSYKLDVVGISRSDYHVFFNTARNGEAGYVGRGSSNSNDLYFVTYGANALRFLTNSSERMTISSTGNVGIGTTNPSYKLHIYNTSYPNIFLSSAVTECSIYYQNTNGVGWAAGVGVWGSSIGANSFGIGSYTNSSQCRFYIDLNGNTTAIGGVTALSDARHKKVVRDTNLSVEQIANMPSVIFKWTDGKHDNDLHVGTLAQSWQKVLPEVVLEGQDKEHTLSLSYGVAALVAAITTARKVVDHEARIKALEKENKELREEISRLKIA